MVGPRVASRRPMGPLARAFHDPRDPVYRWVDAAVWVLVILSVGLTVAEITVEIPKGWRRALGIADRVILALFALELTLRLATHRPAELDLFDLSPAARARVQVTGRIRYLLRPLVFIDFLTVVALVPALRGLRALRVLRLLRGVKWFRYANPFAHLSGAFQDNKVLYAFAFGWLGLETVIGGLTIFLIEGGKNPAVQSVADGMWWTLVTLTTVGYGDITPVEPLGRVWAALLMVAGMFTLALFAGVVGHTLLHTILVIREEPLAMTRFTDHVVVVGYTEGARLLLDTLTEEIGESTEVVLFGQGERPTGVPPEFRWVSGDPAKEPELGKVHLSHARTLILCADRRLPPQQADAATILGVFTARAFLKHEGATTRRKVPVQIVCEVLEPENEQHARVAGADEVILSTRLGFALLAHTVVQPGTAEVMSRVVSAGAHSVFATPPGMFVGQTVGDVAVALKAQHGAMFLGVRTETDGDDEINPGDDRVVGPREQVLYLATKAAYEA